MNNLAAALPFPDPPFALPQGNARTRRALLLSLALHVLAVALLASSGALEAPDSTPVDTLRIALSPGQTGMPAPSDTPSAPASAAEPEPSQHEDAVQQVSESTPAVVAEQPQAAVATARQATDAPVGMAPALDGMDVMFFEYVRETYEQDLNRWLRERGTFYPPDARAQGLEGNAIVAFSLDRDGRILSLRLDESSGVPLLDEAALETIRRAAPFPPPPAGLPFAVIEDIYLPVRFRLEPP